MKLLLQQDDGTTLELREIERIPDSSDTLLFFYELYLSKSDRERLEYDLSKRTGHPCIVLPPHVTRVVGIRSGAKQCDHGDNERTD